MLKKIKRLLHIIPGVHFYGRWSTPRTGEFIDTGTTYMSQIRRCEICNKTQERIEY